MDDEDEQECKPYLIRPQDAYEAIYGKATLLTDVMIAQIFEAIQYAKPATEEAEEALASVWRKLLSLWEEKAPYEEPVKK